MGSGCGAQQSKNPLPKYKTHAVRFKVDPNPHTHSALVMLASPRLFASQAENSSVLRHASMPYKPKAILKKEKKKK
jgi:hypothetical protein